MRRTSAEDAEGFPLGHLRLISFTTLFARGRTPAIIAKPRGPLSYRRSNGLSGFGELVPSGESAKLESLPARVPANNSNNSLTEMAQRDLEAALQLLAERAQYITGASGAAIALIEDREMICRASAGPSAPALGAEVQLKSSLTGESVRTRQVFALRRYRERSARQPRGLALHSTSSQ